MAKVQKISGIFAFFAYPENNGDFTFTKCIRTIKEGIYDE